MCGHAGRIAALASLFLVFARLECACVDDSLEVALPSRTIKAEHLISKVDLDGCHQGTLQISATDSNFVMESDGSLYVVHDLNATADQMTFDVDLKDSVTSDTWKIHIRLLFPANLQESGRKRRAVLLSRQKRRWRPFPFTITEKSLGPFPEYVGTIRSDDEQDYKILYEITGAGVNEPPVNLFTVEPETGKIFVHRPVDREIYPVFRLTGNARRMGGEIYERPLDLTIKVQDVNDNIPRFTEEEFVVNLPERSATGTSLLNLTATDKDQAKTLNTLLAYRILSQVPLSRHGSLFSIDGKTGEIKTNSDKLDREEQDIYTLEVEVRDLQGKSYGLSSKGKVVIHITDMNDHPPTFKESRYTIEVKENENNIMVLRMPIEDQDVAGTEASRAVFKIVKGNENGNFNISTDPKTNEGLLYLVKPLDAEETSSLQLDVAVENEMPLIRKSTKQQVAVVTVKVLDVDEGPEFVPPVMQLWTKENVALGTVLGSYTAKDPETQSSSGIRYRKLTDLADWVSIDSMTGQIRTTAVLDRESRHVKHNKYNVTVVAMEERTYAFMKPKGSVIPGHFKVPIIIQDQQHQETKDTLNIDICECPGLLSCASRLSSKKAVLGGLGILVMLLAALCLLCLLLATVALYCGGGRKTKLPLSSQGQYQQTLIRSNVEGGGQQDMNLSSLDVPVNHGENIGQMPTRFDESGVKCTSSSFGGVGTAMGMGQQMVDGSSGAFYDHTGTLIVDRTDYVDGGTTVGDTHTFGHRRSHGLMELLRSQVDQVYEDEQDDNEMPFEYVRGYPHDGENSVQGSIGYDSDRVNINRVDYMNGVGNTFGTLTNISLKK
ncbi:desmocollin-1-like isoform X2 [Rhinoraja longicauda]